VFGGSQQVGVEPAKILERDRVVGRIEILQVPEEKAQGIADLAIGLGVAGHDLVGDPDVLAEVDHRRPQPEDVGPVLFQQIVGGDHVAHRLRHLVPVGIDHETVRHDLAVGRRSLEPDRRHQR